MEIPKPSRCRRKYPEEFKLAVIDACCEPGASVAGIALANGINANQVRRWMHVRGVEPPSRRLLIDTAPASGDIRIELRRAFAVIKIEWPAQSSNDCAAWLRDWLR